MAELTPQLYFAQVMHKRFFPKVNAFRYRVYYLAAPLAALKHYKKGRLFGFNRFGFLSFYEKDHGARDGKPLEQWIRPLLHEHGLEEATGDVVLVSMPRVLGYGFNPVSFWLCLDADGHLRAVVSEVSNTFGEYHCYLTARQDHEALQKEDVLVCEKLFHVSPFIKREGYYRFRFDYRPQESKLGVWIHYFDAQDRCELTTSMTGFLEPYTTRSYWKAVLRHPLVTIKVITLIHYQAIRLMLKSVAYIRKPPKKDKSFSTNITKTSPSGHASVTTKRLG